MPAHVRKETSGNSYNRVFLVAVCWQTATEFVVTTLSLIGQHLSEPWLDCNNSPSPENACCVITKLQKCLQLKMPLVGRHDCRDTQRALEGVFTHQFLASRCLQYLKLGKPTAIASSNSFNNLLSNRYFQYPHKPCDSRHHILRQTVQRVLTQVFMIPLANSAESAAVNNTWPEVYA